MEFSCVIVFGIVVMFLIFRVCGYARFTHCEASYDTLEARYRPFVYSFIYDSNVEFRTSKKGISQASGHNTEGASIEHVLDSREHVALKRQHTKNKPNHEMEISNNT
jgi:hypothetical protein